MKTTEIDGGARIDWGRISGDYAKYRDLYPPEFYRRIVELGLCVKDQNVLDLGTGTGVLPRNLYHHGARFTGSDPSEPQIREAVRLSEEGGMVIEYRVAGAESREYPSRAFDVVTACQCFPYFNRGSALPNIHRILRDDGRFCVIWVAWLPEEDLIAGASEALVQQINPKWTGGGYRRVEAPNTEWVEPLFRLEHAVTYDLQIPFTRESWHGRMRACRGVGASELAEEEIAAFEAEHRRLMEEFPGEFAVRHQVTMVVVRKVRHGSREGGDHTPHVGREGSGSVGSAG